MKPMPCFTLAFKIKIMADDDDRPRLKFKFKLDSGFLNSEEPENEVYSKLGKDKKKKKKKRRR